MMKFLNYSLSLSLSLRELNCEIFIKKTSLNESNIFVKSYLSRGVLRAGGAGLSDEQREEMTNREGVATGGAT